MSAAASIAAVSISNSHSSNASVLAQTKQTSSYRLLLDEKRKSRFLPAIEVKRIGGGRTISLRERRGIEITAKTAGASKNIEVEVDKPLGLTLGQKSGGGVVITAVDSGGNAAKAGLKSGDQVLYTSSFFGDELWPADKLGFTKTAIQAKPDSVYFVVSRYEQVL
ncbi:hypothetical protein MA16_Dca011349 [Dendrobium catenatum]|uniref:PDZ domain-containing protein n=1 Tax=Dendrobium catenatum TaxID=906689 RepID=A0A2I0WIT1_9ASPA|nr:hypothetical protein MA16_Dca011349 [Dendrobium catenatum]